MSFSDNLRTMRKEKNLSQEELADMLGVSRQAVSKWESGEGYPEVEKLLIIAKELNVSLDSLMYSEMFSKETAPGHHAGHITIVSPNEGVVADCTKVMKSQPFKGGKNSPRFALYAQDQNENSFWGPTGIFLGWYMTEDQILQEINGIHQAIAEGAVSYELKFSVKCRKTFLKIVRESADPSEQTEQ